MPRDCTGSHKVQEMYSPLVHGASHTMNILNKRIVLPTSRAWLTAALDPFHDWQYDIDGLPDEKGAPSVVQIHNQVYTLTAPTSATANWDASVFFTGLTGPINYSMEMFSNHSMSSFMHYNSGIPVTGAQFNTLNIRACSAGHECFNAGPVETDSTAVALGAYEEGAADACRLIGVGIEIVNTTADIYKQGSVTVAMLPDACVDVGTVLYHDVNAAPWLDKEFQSDKLTTMPSCVGQLRTVPGATTWAAKDGVYMIPRLTSLPKGLVNHPAAGRICQFKEYTAAGVSRNWAYPVPTHSETLSGITVPNMYNNYVSGFTPIQAYFTGLSNETTLTITMRTIVEYFPPVMSPLLPLASPSAPYDPKALELYNWIITEAPYAVPVGENASGDYFRKILAVIRSLAPIAGGLFEGIAPGSSAVGASVGAVANTVMQMLEAKAKAPIKFPQLPKPTKKPLPPVPVRRNESGPGAMPSRKRR